MEHLPPSYELQVDRQVTKDTVSWDTQEASPDLSLMEHLPPSYELQVGRQVTKDTVSWDTQEASPDLSLMEHLPLSYKLQVGRQSTKYSNIQSHEMPRSPHLTSQSWNICLSPISSR
jgi:hypothetical protein